jgi:hypothetical protein
LTALLSFNKKDKKYYFLLESFFASVFVVAASGVVVASDVAVVSLIASLLASAFAFGALAALLVVAKGAVATERTRAKLMKIADNLILISLLIS